MKRNTTEAQAVLDRMSYANPTIVAKWKEKFPKKQTELKLIQKTPLVFQLNRKDAPLDFDRIAFVIRATAKNDKVPAMQTVHIEPTETGSRLVATDGKRLHLAEIERKIDGGDYIPVMTKDVIGFSALESEVTFPNWQRVVPENLTKKGSIDLENTGFGKDEKLTENLALAVSTLTRQTGETINLRYLEDLPKKSWEIYSQKARGKALMFRQKGAEKSVFALLMPLLPERVDAALKMAA
jgi:hypothetical protein